MIIAALNQYVKLTKTMYIHMIKLPKGRRRMLPSTVDYRVGHGSKRMQRKPIDLNGCDVTDE